MQKTTARPQENNIPVATLNFYRDVLELLNQASLPYLIGGAYALNHYSGINRETHDLDIFIKRDDYEKISDALTNSGFLTELTYPHWLGKIIRGDDVIDLVFSSGNGIAEVDDLWFQNAAPASIFGITTKLCPAEETIWSKAYIMEKERFDGADIAHLILARGAALDWSRLLGRFGSHWRLLLSHLCLFGFIYPNHRHAVPQWVMNKLTQKLEYETATPSPEQDICGGTLLSRQQYLNDIQRWGYRDARLPPYGNMSQRDTEQWTQAIDKKEG